MPDAYASNKKKDRSSRSDGLIKIFCFFAAFLLWIYVMVAESPGDEYVIENVPVQLINTEILERDAKLSVYSGYDNYVNVTISGKRSVISQISADDIIVTADVSGIQRAAQTSVKVSVAVPEDCEFVSVSKSAIFVKADNYVKKNVDIYGNLLNKNSAYIYDEAPVFRSSSESNQALTTDSYIVDSVIVSGPQSLVETVAKAVVDIDLTDRNTKFTSLLPIYLVDADNRRLSNENLEKAFDFVQVTMPIYVSKTVPIDLIFKHGYLSDTDSIVAITPEFVTVTCDPADADKPDLLDSLYIDEKRSFTRDTIKNQLFETTFTLTSPYDVRLSSTQAQVRVEIDENIFLREMDVTEIQKTNGVVIDCDVLSDSVDDVVICGSREALADVRVSDIIAVVDLGGYTENNIGERFNKTVSIEIDSEYADDTFILGEYTVEIVIIEKENK